jgi:hypothetical protein
MNDTEKRAQIKRLQNVADFASDIDISKKIIQIKQTESNRLQAEFSPSLKKLIKYHGFQVQWTIPS